MDIPVEAEVVSCIVVAVRLLLRQTDLWPVKGARERRGGQHGSGEHGGGRKEAGRAKRSDYKGPPL